MPSDTRKPGSRSRRSKVLWTLAALLLLLAGAAALALKPLKNAYDDRRAEKEVEIALELYRRGKNELAFNKALEARELAPENPQVMRLLGKLLTEHPGGNGCPGPHQR